MPIGLHSWSKTFLSEFCLSFAFLEVFLGGGGGGDGLYPKMLFAATTTAAAAVFFKNVFH